MFRVVEGGDWGGATGFGGVYRGSGHGAKPGGCMEAVGGANEREWCGLDYGVRES